MMETEIERCPTGIDGLDELIGGGFPRGRVILLSGKCGTGKTIFGGQFLYNGAAKYDEHGIYVSFEQNPMYLRRDLATIGIDFKKFEENGKLSIIDASLSNVGPLSLGIKERIIEREHKPRVTLLPQDFVLEKLLLLIKNLVAETNAKRIVIDSVSSLDKLLENQVNVDSQFKLNVDLRRCMLGINYGLQTLGLTSILISDFVGENMSSHGIEEYMADGVLTLHFPKKTDIGRHLIIEKMRSTAHSELIHGIKFIKGKGIQVLDSH